MNEKLFTINRQHDQLNQIPRSIGSSHQIPERVIIELNPHHAIVERVEDVHFADLMLVGARQDLHFIKCTTFILQPGLSCAGDFPETHVLRLNPPFWPENRST
jgi:hypothetical protein